MESWAPSMASNFTGVELKRHRPQEKIYRRRDTKKYKRVVSHPPTEDLDSSEWEAMYLDGHARFYRQSIILTSYLTPEINSVFNHLCLNYKGKMKVECKYKGVVQEVLHSINQVYEKFDADSMKQVDHARLEYFTKKIFPKIKDSVQGGVMIFVNSNAEFCMLGNFLRTQKATFCIVNEYVRNKVKSKARQGFFAGSKRIMLYTERAYFYFRYKIRGIKKLIIYSLPERKEFYPQIMNMLGESHDMESTALFCPFDHLRLELWNLVDLLRFLWEEMSSASQKSPCHLLLTISMCWQRSISASTGRGRNYSLAHCVSTNPELETNLIMCEDLTLGHSG